MSERSPPFAVTDQGVRVAVRVTPRAGRTRVEGLAADAGGATAVKVAVAEAPEKGRANAALLRLLAKEWRVPRSALSIARGTSERRKTVFVAGEPAALARHLTDWIGERDG